MTTATAYEIVRAAQYQNAEFQGELTRLEQAERENRELQKQVAADLDTAWRDLCAIIVPSLQRESLDVAAQRVGRPDIGAAAIEREYQSELKRLQDVVARVEANPVYVNRAGRFTEIDVRARELKEFIEPLKESIGPLQKEPFLDELLQSGYGTPAYAQGWWTMSYYRHWKEGDLLVEKYGPVLKVADFTALRRKFMDERNTLRSLESTLLSLIQERARGEKLVQERKDALAAIEKLPETLLARARALVREQLQYLNDVDRMRVASGSADAELAVKRVSGIEAKQRYLEGLLDEMVRKPREDLKRAMEKNHRDIIKYQRPKNTGVRIARADFDRRYRSRRSSWDKRWRRYHDNCHRIVVYDSYHHYNPVSDFLWWDVMTDGHLDGNFIPEVAEFHHHHPGWHHHHHHDHHHDHHDHAFAAVAHDTHVDHADHLSDAS